MIETQEYFIFFQENNCWKKMRRLGINPFTILLSIKKNTLIEINPAVDNLFSLLGSRLFVLWLSVDLVSVCPSMPLIIESIWSFTFVCPMFFYFLFRLIVLCPFPFLIGFARSLLSFCEFILFGSDFEGVLVSCALNLFDDSIHQFLRLIRLIEVWW